MSKHLTLSLKGFVLSLVFSACQTGSTDQTAVLETPFPTIPDSAVLIGPGVVSSDLPEFATTWNPELNLLLFNRTSSDRRHILIYSTRFQAGQWTTPEALPFSDTTYRDIDPFIHGNRVFFASERLVDGTPPMGDLDLLYSDFQDEDWSSPERISSSFDSKDTEFYLTATRDGSKAVYSSFEAGTSNARVFQTNLNELDKGTQQAVFQNDTARVTNPAIAPDGSFLLFTTRNLPGYGSVDIYICFWDEKASSWSNPINLGPKVNTEHVEFAPGISPDGKLLFFSSERPGVVQNWPEGERRPGDLYVIGLEDLVEEARNQ